MSVAEWDDEPQRPTRLFARLFLIETKLYVRVVYRLARRICPQVMQTFLFRVDVGVLCKAIDGDRACVGVNFGCLDLPFDGRGRLLWRAGLCSKTLPGSGVCWRHLHRLRHTQGKRLRLDLFGGIASNGLRCNRG